MGARHHHAVTVRFFTLQYLTSRRCTASDSSVEFTATGSSSHPILANLLFGPFFSQFFGRKIMLLNHPLYSSIWPRSPFSRSNLGPWFQLSRRADIYWMPVCTNIPLSARKWSESYFFRLAPRHRGRVPWHGGRNCGEYSPRPQYAPAPITEEKGNLPQEVMGSCQHNIGWVMGI